MNEFEIPKIIWIFWNTGFDKAHPVVKNCVQSWEIKNPNWKVVLLTQDNLSDYINKPDVPVDIFDKLPIQKQANLIRLKLLVEHGGVWADATCYCMKPLDEWLRPHAPTGVFMFSNPGRDRIISNWFIASSKRNYLINELYKSRCDYWTKYTFNRTGFMMKKVMPHLDRVINRNHKCPMLWFSSLFTKVLKISPYLIFHYDFYRLINRDKQCEEIWAGVKKISADEPHKVQRLGMLNEITEKTKQYIQDTDVPVFKLNYKFKPEKLTKNTLLHFLFHR